MPPMTVYAREQPDSLVQSMEAVIDAHVASTAPHPEVIDTGARAPVLVGGCIYLRREVFRTLRHLPYRDCRPSHSVRLTTSRAKGVRKVLDTLRENASCARVNRGAPPLPMPDRSSGLASASPVRKEDRPSTMY